MAGAVHTTVFILALLSYLSGVLSLPSLPPVPAKIKNEIAGYKGVAHKIINLSVHGKAQNQSYNRLAEFVDTFGSRIAGSQNLENAIDYMLKVMKDDGLENVHGEEVMVPHWVRGNESCTMLEPRQYKVSIMGLGSSVGTRPQGIKAEALVVHSFDELHSRASEAKGKIIIFDHPFVNYGVSVGFRYLGASEAAKVGGVASLIRSAASFSIHSPHTGQQHYEDNVTKVPTACIAVEDAEMFSRMAARGTKIVLHLKMEAKNLPAVMSRNTVAEIKGREHPEQVVLVSGHLDSWDVGQGAMDDGGGAFISWQALSLIRQLGLRPRRTLRAVLWTAEEEGALGGAQYYQRHKANISNYNFVMESDFGVFTPVGLYFRGNAKATSIMTEVASLLKPINASQLIENAEAGGEDIAPWMQHNVPSGTLHHNSDRYFWFHHSDGDTMSVQDPHAMDLCSAVWAVTAYVVADMEDMLPRD